MAVSERARLIEERLRERLDSVHVEIVDDSVRHADHLGARGGGGHFRVLVVSQAFEGLSRVAAQRWSMTPSAISCRATFTQCR